jgi:hypothetical protein
MRKRREDDPDDLCIDWGLAAYCLPQVFAGVMLGSVLNLILPSGYIFVTIFLTFVIIAFFVDKKTKVLEIQEMSNVPDKTSNKSLFRDVNSAAEFLKTLTVIERSTFMEILWRTKFPIWIVNLSAVVMIAGLLLRSVTIIQEYLHLAACSVALYIVFVFMAGMNIKLAYYAKTRVQVIYNPKKQFLLSAASILSGVLYPMSPNGSIVFSMMMVALGVDPLFVWPLSTFLMFYTSSLGLAELLLTSNLALDIGSVGVVCGVAFVGAVVGNLVLQRAISKTRGVNSYIASSAQLILALSIVVMPFNMHQEQNVNSSFWKFTNIC